MSTNKGKTRLDKLLVDRGLCPSRKRAEALIMAGQVLIDDVPVTKPGLSVANSALIRIRGETSKFVGRGGDKLESALLHFGLDVSEAIVLDVGASTGGFTDCVLQRGAKLVYAVDVGYNQMDWQLRNDARVVVMERINAKDLRAELFLHQPTFCVIDVSFIGLRKVLLSVINVLAKPFNLVALVKPQFELGPEYVKKGGIVPEIEHQLLAVELVSTFCTEHGLTVEGSFASPLRGEKKGNQEYFLYLRG